MYIFGFSGLLRMFICDDVKWMWKGREQVNTRANTSCRHCQPALTASPTVPSGCEYSMTLYILSVRSVTPSFQPSPTLQRVYLRQYKMLKYFIKALGCPQGIIRICVTREGQYSGGEGDEDKFEVTEYDAAAKPVRRFEHVQTSQQTRLETQSTQALAGEKGEGNDDNNGNAKTVTNSSNNYSNSNNKNKNHATHYTNSETLQGTNGNGNGSDGYDADEEAQCLPLQPGYDVRMPLTFTYSSDNIPLIGKQRVFDA